MPYESLGGEVGRAAIGPGVSARAKAARVSRSLADGGRPPRQIRRHPAVREVLDDGRSALPVPPGDPRGRRRAGEAQWGRPPGRPAAGRAAYPERAPRGWRRRSVIPSTAPRLNSGVMSERARGSPASARLGRRPLSLRPPPRLPRGTGAAALLPALPAAGAGAGAGTLSLKLVDAGLTAPVVASPALWRVGGRCASARRGGQPGAARRRRPARPARRPSTPSSAPRCWSTWTTTGALAELARVPPRRLPSSPSPRTPTAN